MKLDWLVYEVLMITPSTPLATLAQSILSCQAEISTIGPFDLVDVGVGSGALSSLFFTGGV